MRCLLTAAISLLCFAPEVAAWERMERVAVERPGTLVIELDAGSVEVRAHAGSELVIETEARGLGASGVRFAVVREGDAVRVGDARDAWLRWLRNGPRVRVRVRVPAGFDVRVASAQRALLCTELRGTLSAVAAGGYVHLLDAVEAGEATTGAGSACRATKRTRVPAFEVQRASARAAAR